MNPKTAIVTGGCGFIGVHTCLRLLRDEWLVIAVDNLSRLGTERNLHELKTHSRFEHAKVDVRDFNALEDLLISRQPDLIIHLAGQVAVTTSIKDPRSDFEINVIGAINLLEACRKMKAPPLVVYSSTNKVYGSLNHLDLIENETRFDMPKGWQGVTESQPLEFYSPYGCSKGAADQYFVDYSRMYGIPTVVVRQSCIYGPKQLGVEDQGWVAWFAIAALTHRPITIFGDGKQVRDLLHVNDLVDFYLALEQEGTTFAGEVFNIGGGAANSLSLLEYLKFLDANDVPADFNFADTRPGDQRIFVSDNSKAQLALGWQPRRSARDGLIEMIEDLRASIAAGAITQ
jgi:CDP-paratose 2-epimerase